MAEPDDQDVRRDEPEPDDAEASAAEADSPEADGPETNGHQVDGPETNGHQADGPETDPQADGPEASSTEAGGAEGTDDTGDHARPVTGEAVADTRHTDVGSLGYEQARDELIRIVARIESGQAGLEESMRLWERGEALAAHCSTWLDQAQSRLDDRQERGGQ